jgi:soluble lytic murein transglycosylase-like protein
MTSLKCKLGSVFILLILFIFFDIIVAKADNYIRIDKKGVIYYYFSNKDSIGKKSLKVRRNSGTKLASHSTGRTEINLHKMVPIIHEASERYNLPPSLIKAVIRVESNFNPTATSPKGAQGLMQLMPKTAADLGVSNPYDIEENIWGGTRYLSLMLEKFNHSLPNALAAYNAGPGRVEKFQTVPPIRETQNFVRDVCINLLKYEREKGQTP